MIIQPNEKVFVKVSPIIILNDLRRPPGCFFRNVNLKLVKIYLKNYFNIFGIFITTIVSRAE